ncbi:HTH-type transcriptional regulator GntR [Methylobacterium cerastii]|uniref:HTH-type transcriptional regulator GntR n=1 Tax=Methylobacterium cerastii TaxID=932741 RepID=A0ABQ4QB33_9HYPH|nr:MULTISPECIES: LacI family DNA-binding transcriptional regulator [Methylobacterium]TXN03340.1 LacI family DNA-binding transcriptional regulator [Methylobacterium sp. WL122]TXN84896.1 LacI family DNA-binding transcriptional regulator [Methylobacterium sp. WL8]GJD42417.1 HTH-type transcriptional regulator GntR [Methylobacterium cerastii]
MNLHRRLVTLADVARESGFGESTVSRVLRNQGSFSKRTADRVAEAVAKLGYVPNRLAGSLAGNAASAGSQLVGIVIPSLANIVFPDLLRGLTGALDRTGFQSVIGVSDYDPDREEALVAALLSWRPAGLVLTGLEHNPDTVALLRAAGIRVVEMIDTDGPGLDLVVGFSNRAVGEASAAHLVARGYRRIGYVGHDILRDLRAGKRLAGFEAALQGTGYGLIDREIVAEPSSATAGRAALDRLLDRTPDLDAVYFSNDDMALGGYFCCLARGWSIPHRLALFGYNGLDITAAMPQPLSTIRTPRLRIGEIAAERLAAGGPAETIDLGFALVAGATA